MAKIDELIERLLKRKIYLIPLSMINVKDHAAISELKAEKDRYREALERIQTAAQFHSQDGLSNLVIRYAHESTARLATEALGGNDE
jgi:hypothetical protein